MATAVLPASAPVTARHDVATVLNYHKDNEDDSPPAPSYAGRADTVVVHDITGDEARSVDEADLVPIALVYPNRRGETYGVRPNPGHRWFFKYAQRPDEVTLIKCYDALADGRARRVPHTAFVDPAEADKPPRASIEVRVLVFYA